MVKLFDFGLAKRWKTAELAADQHNYHLTGQTGSLRYMAPEVAMEQPYNESCDVYSWGILYWQVCSLTTPFSKYSARQHADKVVFGGQRPVPESSWPRPWRELMVSSWQSMPALRPTMSEVLDQVHTFCQSLTSEDDDDDDVNEGDYVGGGDVEAGGSAVAVAGTNSLLLTESTNTKKIRAKTKQKQTKDAQMDVDTRLHTGAHVDHPPPVGGRGSGTRNNDYDDDDNLNGVGGDLV